MVKPGSINKLTALILALAILLSATIDVNSYAMADSSETVISENIQIETTITEKNVTELITDEIYLQEIIVAENKISELLLEEDCITEVLLCKTIYVPQDNIKEFASNSQTAELFGDDIKIGPLLTKVAIGTGVIITLVVLKSANFAKPIASMIVAAADESITYAAGGTAVGTLFGGLTGAANEIDETGRTSAIVGFATATVGLIISIVSLIAEIPSGGSSSITAAVGVKMVIAGIGVLTTAAGTAYSGYKAIKTLNSTDCAHIDWNSIDWNSVGVSAAEQAINYGADGYMWGALVGAVHGGADGYEYYHKFSTPYTKLADRLKQIPKDNEKGHWSGAPGESDYILNEPIISSDGTEIISVTYKNGVPDFSAYEKAEVKISCMTNQRLGRNGNYEQADQALAKLWTSTKYEGHSWLARDVATYRTENGLTWHEMSNMEYMQLVPNEVNSTFKHFGGVAEYNAMTNKEEVAEFD